MPRIAIAVVACLLAGLLAPSARAQSPSPATHKGFSFCSVHDSAAHKIWASPVFEVEYASGDAGSRTQEMATDFYNFIGSMGGAGDKDCAIANSDRATVEASRNEQRQILTQRFMGMVRANKWLDVAWTPKPWSPALLVKPAVTSKFFYCYGTDTDQRDTTASTVASQVFEKSMDGADAMAPYTMAQDYGKEFSQYVLTVHALTQANPSCYFKDTRAEADKALRDYRKLFGGFNTKYDVVAWTPTGQASAKAAPASITTSSKTVPAAAPPAAPGAKPPVAAHGADVAPAAAASTSPAAGSAKHCHTFIQFVGKPGGVHTRVWENTGSDGSPAAMAASLTAFVAHMRQLQPKTWLEFNPTPAQCDANNGFCYATVVRQFGRSQLAGQFCKTTREEADADWARLAEHDRTMEVVAWPVEQ